MAKYQVFGATSPEVSQREKDHWDLARRAASEGFVLLKNDGVLPLAPCPIGLYGTGSRFTVKGGSGSGEVNGRHSVTIEEGLKNAGFTFNTLYMERLEKKFTADINAWKDEVNKAIKCYNIFTTMKMFDEIHRHPKPLPSCTPVREDELDHTTDTAIYVLSRQAGEGQDRDNKKGDYQLSDVEAESLKLLSQNYKKLILIINCGSSVDLSVLDEIRIDAVLFFGQGGMQGGNALADVLTGKRTPCGKLTDTWAMKYDDYPSYNTYSHLKGNVEHEEYYEGIYVGYRYFETFHKKVRFPFGYGLSYTTFDHKADSISLNGTVLTLKASVTNTGKQYSGREILQVYVRKPNGRIDTESIDLVAFGKTKTLNPSESVELTLSFDLHDMSVFDESQASFVLLKGEYGVYLGTSAEEIKPVAVIDLDEEITLERVSLVNNRELTFKDLKSETETREYDSSLPRFKADSSAFTLITHQTYKPQFSDKIKNILSGLGDKEKTMLAVGGAYKLKSYNAVMGAAGRTNTELLNKGIPNIIMSDGPAGLNVTPKVVILKNGAMRFIDEVPEEWQWGWIKKFGFIAKADPKKGRPAYRYMTAWPNETLQAQTWDVSLLEEIGRAVGREMLEIGVSIWLAPGMNIHRNPLCGRNFEYYSEDPLISGKMAAAITKGVQSMGGVGVSVKHFCCNNQEDNRYANSSNVSQRALREVYLRAFHIAVTEGKPWTVMSCYNLVNGTYVCNSRELVTGVLRDEWGFDGLVMSDWSACDKATYYGAINAGNDLIMPGNEQIQKKLLQELKEGKVDRTALDISVSRVLELIFKSEVNKNFNKLLIWRGFQDVR